MIAIGICDHVICTPNIAEGKFLAYLLQASGIPMIGIEKGTYAHAKHLYIHEDLWPGLQILLDDVNNIIVWTTREILWEPASDGPIPLESPKWVDWDGVKVSGIFGSRALYGIFG